MSFISIKNLKFSYSVSNIKAIDDISLSIEKGEYVAILGNNGSGKSTLARLIFGFLEATEGTIEIAQSEKPIGFVQQNPKYQIIAGTVEKDTAFGPENLGLPEVEIKTRTQNCLKQVELLEKATEKTAELLEKENERLAPKDTGSLKSNIDVSMDNDYMAEVRAKSPYAQYVIRGTGIYNTERK